MTLPDAGADVSATGPASGGRGLRTVIWSAGIAVALGAAAATAHGLYEVAVAARVPAGIAWLYPLITDGLALVAYAATARLRGSEARYAWGVVVTAAGLSGLAQAAYLAGDGGPAQVAPALRFGIGAWPAVAAAVVAHLLYLLATTGPASEASHPGAVQTGVPVQADPAVQPSPLDGALVQPGAVAGPVQPDPAASTTEPPDPTTSAGPRPADAPTRALPSPVRDRADAAALRHARRHGAWPTVTELETSSGVSRGTAAAALKALRVRPLPLHALPADPGRPADPNPIQSAPTASPRPDASAIADDSHDQDDALPNPEAHR